MIPTCRYLKKYCYLCTILNRYRLKQIEQNIINIKTLFIMAYVIGDDCIACGTCIDECPSGAISEGEKYSIDPDACTECGTCADVCPNEAISLP